VLVLAACSDTLPVEQPRSAVPRLSVAREASNRYVVLLGPGAQAERFSRSAESLGGTVVAVHEGAGFAVVEGLSANGAARLAREPGVQGVEPDLTAQVVNPATQWLAGTAVEEAGVDAASQSNPATAGLFIYQWNLRAIGAPTAWAAGQLGSSSVKVAILDSGIDDTWPDLVGLVDATRSASFLPTSSIAEANASRDCSNPTDHELINGRPAFIIPASPDGPAKTCAALSGFFPGKPPWADLNGHGTFTAQMVSSKAINFAGVTSKVTLMAVKVLNARGAGSFSSILQGAAYATDRGADVINMSLGAAFLRHGGYIGFLNGITRYARSRGVTIVVAAGNDAIDLDHSGGVYTAFCSSGMVICVSATGPVLALGPNGQPSPFGPFFQPPFDEPATYSNFGTSSIDVAAPGGNYALDEDGKLKSAAYILAGCSRTALDYIPADPEATPPTDAHYVKSICTVRLTVVGAYGTSISSPHVAGLAALLVERHGRNPGQIRTIIQQTADDLGKPGADAHYGKGRINVPRALGL
jgi:subtilisin family serine protease